MSGRHRASEGRELRAAAAAIEARTLRRIAASVPMPSDGVSIKERAGLDGLAPAVGQRKELIC